MDYTFVCLTVILGSCSIYASAHPRPNKIRFPTDEPQVPQFSKQLGKENLQEYVEDPNYQQASIQDEVSYHPMLSYSKLHQATTKPSNLHKRIPERHRFSPQKFNPNQFGGKPFPEGAKLNPVLKNHDNYKHMILHGSPKPLNVYLDEFKDINQFKNRPQMVLNQFPRNEESFPHKNRFPINDGLIDHRPQKHQLIYQQNVKEVLHHRPLKQQMNYHSNVEEVIHHRPQKHQFNHPGEEFIHRPQKHQINHPNVDFEHRPKPQMNNFPANDGFDHRPQNIPQGEGILVLRPQYNFPQGEASFDHRPTHIPPSGEGFDHRPQHNFPQGVEGGSFGQRPQHNTQPSGEDIFDNQDHFQQEFGHRPQMNHFQQPGEPFDHRPDKHGPNQFPQSENLDYEQTIPYTQDQFLEQPMQQVFVQKPGKRHQRPDKIKHAPELEEHSHPPVHDNQDIQEAHYENKKHNFLIHRRPAEYHDHKQIKQEEPYLEITKEKLTQYIPHHFGNSQNHKNAHFDHKTSGTEWIPINAPEGALPAKSYDIPAPDLSQGHRHEFHPNINENVPHRSIESFNQRINNVVYGGRKKIENEEVVSASVMVKQ